MANIDMNNVPVEDVEDDLNDLIDEVEVEREDQGVNNEEAPHGHGDVPRHQRVNFEEAPQVLGGHQDVNNEEAPQVLGGLQGVNRSCPISSLYPNMWIA